MDDRQPELARQRVGLIEATLEAAPAMQRHRHDAVRIAEQTFTSRSHQRTKLSREYPPTVVLERLENVTKRAVVIAGGAGRVDERRSSAAARAPFQGRADDAPRDEWVAARTAERGGAEADAAPTIGADGAVEWSLEYHATGRTAWRERDGEQRI